MTDAVHGDDDGGYRLRDEMEFWSLRWTVVYRAR